MVEKNGPGSASAPGKRISVNVAFRGDAAFAKPEVYEALEARDVKYAIRVPANDSLERDIAEMLPRPVGVPAVSRWWSTRGFSTRRRVGRQPGGWWRKWSIMPASSREWASS